MVVRDSLAIARRILRRTTNMTNMARLWTYAEPLSWSNHKWFDCSKTNFTGPKASEGPDATSKSTLWILSDHHMLPTKCLEVGGWWNETDLCACHPIILFSWPSRHPFLKSFHQRGTNRMGDANPNAKENKIPLGMLGCEIWVRSLAPGGGCWFPSGFDWMLVHTSALSKKKCSTQVPPRDFWFSMTSSTMPLVDHMEKICEFQRHSWLENCLFVSPSAKYMTTFKTLAPIIWSKVSHICIGNGTICEVKTDGENSPTCSIHGSPGSTERLHLDICFRKANAIQCYLLHIFAILCIVFRCRNSKLQMLSYTLFRAFWNHLR